MSKSKSLSKANHKLPAESASSLASSLDNHFLKKTVSLADLMADSEDDDAVPSAKHPQLAPQKATISKRKVSQVIELSSSDSSDDSVRVVPNSSPKKKVRKVERPLPGGSDFDRLEPMSTSRPSSPDRTLNIGEVTLLPNGSSVINSPTATRRSTRKIVPTEKAKAIKGATSTASSILDKSPSGQCPRDLTRKGKKALAARPIALSSDSDDLPDVSQIMAAVSPGLKGPVLVKREALDDAANPFLNHDNDAVSEDGDISNQGSPVVHPVSTDGDVVAGNHQESDDVEGSLSDSEFVARASNVEDRDAESPLCSPRPPTPQQPVPPPIAVSAEPNADPDEVLFSSLFADQPALETERILTPFSSRTQPMLYGASLSDLQTKLRPEDLRCVIAGVKMKKVGIYCNLARLDATTFTKATIKYPPSEKFCFSDDPKTFPIAVMVMSVEDCNIIEPGELGFDNPYKVRRCLGLPLNYMWERDVDVWGSVLEFTEIPAPVSFQGIWFSSQGEGKGRQPQLMDSPSKPKSSAAVLRSPMKKALPTSAHTAGDKRQSMMVAQERAAGGSGSRVKTSPT